MVCCLPARDKSDHYSAIEM
uniref:Uncharacterized protein n=1 Tax=Anopheles arabiensis TaxID=7173 RepID=A0A182IG73_ANOAR